MPSGPVHAAIVLDLLNTKTALLVLRECFYGSSRFEDSVDRIGTSGPAVSRALKQLESAGSSNGFPIGSAARDQRTPISCRRPGEDLLPVVLALGQWGDDHLQGGLPPLAFVDVATGQPIRVRVTAGADVPDLRPKRDRGAGNVQAGCRTLAERCQRPPTAKWTAWDGRPAGGVRQRVNSGVVVDCDGWGGRMGLARQDEAGLDLGSVECKVLFH